jgi:aspartate aminotransferase
MAENPDPGTHRYMNNAGYEETRTAVAKHIEETSGVQI